MLISHLLGILLVIPMPEPGTMPTLAVYAAALGLFVWYRRKRAKRPKV
jgi:hypothetical protein